LKLLNKENVELIHDEILSRMGERKSGCLYEGGLAYCVEAAIDLYSDMRVPEVLIWKAAYYMWCLITNHPFLDGNKRTAYLTASTFLLANGYMLKGVDPCEAVSVLGGVTGCQA
jgi:death-on-curing protein